MSAVNKEQNDIEFYISEKLKQWKDIIKYGVIIIIVAFLQPYRLTIIDSAEIGIKFHKWSTDAHKKGGVEGTCRGLLVYNHYTTDIFRYPTYIQRKTYEPFNVNAKDASVFTMEPQIAYRLDGDKVCDIFIKYRKGVDDLENGYIRTCIYEAYRTCANDYNSDYLMSHRAEFENNVRQRLEKSLECEGFIVEEFTSAITPPKSLARTIDEKNAAIQSALKAENQVKEAEANAKIKIAQAKGQAESLKISAEAEADANDRVAKSITPLLIQKMWIEKWNGSLPKTMTGKDNMMLIPTNN